VIRALLGLTPCRPAAERLAALAARLEAVAQSSRRSGGDGCIENSMLYSLQGRFSEIRALINAWHTIAGHTRWHRPAAKAAAGTVCRAAVQLLFGGGRLLLEEVKRCRTEQPVERPAAGSSIQHQGGSEVPWPDSRSLGLMLKQQMGLMHQLLSEYGPSSLAGASIDWLPPSQLVEWLAAVMGLCEELQRQVAGRAGEEELIPSLCTTTVPSPQTLRCFLRLLSPRALACLPACPSTCLHTCHLFCR